MAQTIAIKDIVIPEARQRRGFNPQRMTELIDSVYRMGLMHAIVLRDDGKTLIAGQRRLKAVEIMLANQKPVLFNGQMVEMGHIPFVYMSELDEISLREAELEENLIRENLTWLEETAAIKAIHELKRARDATHTRKDTADLLAGKNASGRQGVEVSDALLVAEHINDPEVQKAGSLKEARKIVARKLEKEFRAELAAKIGPAAFRSVHQLLQGDCLQLLPTIAAGKFDCIVIDPPYGIDADGFGSQSITGHKYGDSSQEFWVTQTALAPELFRVMKDSSHLYMFCDIEAFEALKTLYKRAGFSVWRTPLVWDKASVGMLPDLTHGPRRCYETIMFASKGRRPVTMIRGDVLGHMPVIAKDHAAQKPVELYVDLLERSCFVGDEVLDCFCGNGTIFAAANRLSLRATGIEKDPASFTLAAGTLNNQGKADVTLHSEKEE